MGNAAPASVSYDGVTSMLQGQGLDLAVIEDGRTVFSTSGVTGTDLSFALAASTTGESPVTMRSGERTMFLKAEEAEGLRDGIATTPQMRERYATRIASKAEEMDGLVSELFMFSKLDLGDFPHEERPVRVDAFLQNVLDNLAPELERTGNTLAQVELAPATALADERLLRQAVTNVLLNASKHAPGSAITVRASVTPGGSHVEVAIADNGPGVPAESLERIFEVFYRTDPSRTAASGGSGLGLAIVQRAMRAMGGEATAENVEPHGLRVTLTLRVAEQAAAENSTGEASA